MKKNNHFRKIAAIGCIMLCLMALLTLPALSKSRKPFTEGNSGSGSVLLPPRFYVSGEILVKGCMPASPDIRVRMNNGQPVYPYRRTVLADGHVRFRYKIQVPAAAGGSFTITASIINSLYQGGRWNPRSITLTQVPAQQVDFQYLAPVSKVHRISARVLAGAIDRFTSGLRMKLHNHKTNDSYIQSGNQKHTFNVPRTTVDLDCGHLCPDMGDGYFYVNNINLTDAHFDWIGGKFKFSAFFEDRDREVKGYHNRLGDNGMPDFQLNNINVEASASLMLTADGKLTFSIYGLILDMDAHSTGGCSPFGVDICNVLFGTNGKIKRGIAGAARSALNHVKIKNVMSDLLMGFLSLSGIEGKITGVRIEGDNIVITTRSSRHDYTAVGAVLHKRG